jgi:CubicO group peptidase (beta-lactamase class C family)
MPVDTQTKFSADKIFSILHCFFVPMLFFICSISCNGQNNKQPYPKEIADQIKLVENSLSGQLKFEGISGDNILDEMSFYKVKGLSIAVIKDYRIIWAKGYGWADEGENQKADTNTLFMAASVTKSVNSMGVMKLVQDKKLDLNNDINNYLVSWKFPYDKISNGKKITTLNLLTHTAGINDAAPQYINKDSVPSILQVLKGSKASKYVYSDPQPARSITEPGKMFQYSNVGVGITQVMVTDITQKSYEDYISETVFRPLRMTSSCYNQSSLNKFDGRLSAGYSYSYEVPGKHLIVPFQSAGGLWTTPSDLARFIIEVQLSLAGKSNKVLSKETVETMLTPYIREAPGFFITQTKPGAEKYFSHSGIIKGFKSEYYGSFDGGSGVVVMINSDGNSGKIIPEVINSVATVYHWKDFYNPEIRKKPITVSRADLDKCEGVYLFEDRYFVILNTPRGGHFWTEWNESKMHFTSLKEFYSIDSETNKELVTDASGNVSAIKRFLNGKQLTSAVKVTDISSVRLTPGQLTEIAWYLLENKRFDQSEKYYQKLLALTPQDQMAKCNMAHCTLFLKDYDKAIKLYREILAQDNAGAFRQTISDDFIFFKSNGFETAFMQKAFGDLGLEVPKQFIH